jgi:Ca2+-binding RTX toxin-like protein
MALVATLLVSASPAAAETDCVQGENGDLIVRVNEDNGAETVLHMANEVLFVNGVSCGSPSPAPGRVQSNITVIDQEPETGLQLDKIRFNLAAGAWRVDDIAVYVNLILDGDGQGNADEVTIVGTSTADQFRAYGDFIRLDRKDLYPGADVDGGYFFMHTINSIDGDASSGFTYQAEYEFLLGGGNDTFNVLPDSDTGGWFGQKVVVKGGSGRDTMNGGPGRQYFYGGKGNDILDGAGGNDRLKGQGGDDVLNGRIGNDYLHGGKGNDRIKGHAGNDTIIGGSGKDRTWGGSGDDTFRMKDGRKDFRVKGGSGDDTCKCDSNDPRGSTARA